MKRWLSEWFWLVVAAGVVAASAGAFTRDLAKRAEEDQRERVRLHAQCIADARKEYECAPLLRSCR